jgi:hypothetical protein
MSLKKYLIFISPAEGQFGQKETYRVPSFVFAVARETWNRKTEVSFGYWEPGFAGAEVQDLLSYFLK